MSNFERYFNMNYADSGNLSGTENEVPVQTDNSCGAKRNQKMKKGCPRKETAFLLKRLGAIGA